jgi:diguanylate cyclase (GGDEF)-like protein
MRLELIAKVRKKLAHWLNPAHEMARLAHQVHTGVISIEEMSGNKVATGRLKPLVKVLTEIQLDLKQQRAELAAIEQEIRDRVANRTDALERKIGSLQVQATRDGLTGLNNRRALDTELPHAIERYKTQARDSCLLMIDVDHFKSLNDALGHAAGDKLLKEIGQLIRSTLRGNDLAYRCGGDEFVVLLDKCNATAGQSTAKRLESLVRELTKSLKVSHPPQLSIGCCALSELPEPTPQLLLQAADKKLYEVKSTRPRLRRSA